MAPATPSRRGEIWQTLASLKSACSKQPLKQRFAEHADRSTQFSAELGALFIDYSKQHIDSDIAKALHTLALDAGLPEKLNAMRSGALCNNTEQRSANYAALRTWAHTQHSSDPAIHTMYENMAAISAGLRSGELCGCTGKPYSHIVNIGIGGSDFGPRLFTEALKESAEAAFECRFLANIDPSCANEALADLPAESTLFIVASKSFGTQETLANAAAAKRWLEQTLPGRDIGKHFIAITANPDAAAKLGVAPDLTLAVPSWVGGRFSVWSGFGLIVAANYGWPCFSEILLGGAEVDEHMASSSLESNLPATLALLDVWYRNSWNISSHAILPYCNRLKQLPDYLQQLFMESAGKTVDRSGHALSRQSGGVIWGSEGTNGQHSFHQLLHQGSDIIPCDFIAALKNSGKALDQQQALLANCFAQSLALMQGKSAKEVEQELLRDGFSPDEAAQLAKHKAMPGNRPSTTILMDELSPRALGNLIALYEYRLICASFIWDINPFDQWGVELGKQLSHQLLGSLRGDTDSNTTPDSSTAQLIERARRANSQ
ncbi:glucose-6-phosphate isomerase [Spongiibacter marinus]|uniref:glucose-6-phosphate isomerase n=1 Tax=Spongiibacter marinus TaxID=354246 RepID=UPI0035612FE9